MMDRDSLSGKQLVLSGSFRKHYHAILKAIQDFESEGWTVLSPAKSRIVDAEADFPLLVSDRQGAAADIEQKHLESIAESDALYVVNPSGYIGISTAMEMGWAFACGVPTFLKEQTDNEIISAFSPTCPTPTRLTAALFAREKPKRQRICRTSSLPMLQAYIANVTAERGFSEESSQDILLLMVEEVGELAKALRRRIGLKVDVEDTVKREIAPELADILIYLLDFANTVSVDLAKALAAKEEVNRTRHWSSSESCDLIRGGSA